MIHYFNCSYCNKLFTKESGKIGIALSKIKNIYCSKSCSYIGRTKKQSVVCKNCNKNFIKYLDQILVTKNNFCSRSCAATYNNTHKIRGNRRSKLEIWLEQELPKLYPTLEFKFNSKEEINSELDIYIPSLKLAFELNGIFHYEPIYGQEKLDQIQNNDNRKFQACLEQGIELCIVDSSQLKYFKPVNGKKYLDMICQIIDLKLSAIETT